MRCLFTVLFIIFGITQAFAANPSEPAWRRAQLNAGFPWSAGLILEIAADENICKKKYGSHWQIKCAAPLGRPGAIERSVKLTPPAPGQWVWDSANTLVFQPADADSLKPDTHYQLDLGGLAIPGFVHLDTLKPACATPPLSAQLQKIEFLPDPASNGIHRLVAALRFNFPMPNGKFAHALELPPGARAGEAELVWSQERDSLHMAWPISHLPDNTGNARLILKNVGQVVEQDGVAEYRSASGRGIIFSQAIPSGKEIFRVTAMKLEAQPNAALDSRYILQLDTTLDALAADVLAHLEIRELPEYNTPAPARWPYDWTAAPAIPKDVLQKARTLTPEPLQRAQDMQSRFRFEIPVQSGRYIVARLNNGLKSGSGNALARSWHGIIRAKPLQGQAGFLQPGNILPGNGIIGLYATDVEAIEWEAHLVREPFLALLAQSSANVSKSPMDIAGLGMDSFSQRATGRIDLGAVEQGKARYASLDLGAVFRRLSGASSGIARVNLRGIRDGRHQTGASRVIIATNLGIIVKKAKDGSLDCFASQIMTGEPVRSVEVHVLGANGMPVASASTDAGGHAHFASLNGMKREMRPVAVVARKDGDLAWMPLDDGSRQLDFSNFDVGGSHVDANGALAFVFAQRGMCRPGDTVYFGCLARKANFELLPPDLPLYAEFIDPRGRRVFEKTFSPGQDGMAELAWTSPPDALSGRYTLNVKNGRNGDVLGFAQVRLEDFQPDTLKMKLEPPVRKGWHVAEPGHAAKLEAALQNFYGMPASGRSIKANAHITPARFDFAEYQGWTFQDPAPFLGNGQSRRLGETKSDADGQATLTLPVDIGSAASARVTVAAEGFELGGGRAVGAVASFIASPMRQILGWRPAGALTNPAFINQNDVAEAQFVSVNANLEKTAWPGLRFSILRRNYVTSLVSDGQGGYRYDDVPQDLIVKSWEASLPDEGMAARLDTSAPGEFLLSVRDKQGHIVAQIPYNVMGESLLDSTSPLAGSKMRMRIDKAEYNPGEEINVAISLPYEAAGVLSIERDGIKSFAWINAHAGDNLAKIRIPNNFEGKGHVVATFMRSPASPAIYMNPLAFAAMPFTANMAGRDMGLEIKAPKAAQPGGKLAFELSAPKQGQALVFVVDEGILRMTNFATPNPLHTLLANRALDVATLQLADRLMPLHGRLAPRLAAFGGGAEGAAFGARFQNPFKRRQEPPLATWSGIVNVGPEPLRLEITLPPWCGGSARIMAVGSGPGCAGSAERAVNIKGPLALMPQLPLAVAPGDVFDGALVLANTADSPIQAQIDMDAGAAYSILAQMHKSITLAPGAEQVLPFRLKALAEPGAQDIVFTAITDNGEKYTRAMSMSIRPPSPLRTTLQAGMAEKSGELEPSRPVYKTKAESSATISGLPLPLAASLARYLEHYPYGCTEQLVSRAFAQISLSRWPAAQAAPEKRQKLLDAALASIASRFQEGNGITLWDQGLPDLLLTAYAADYLLTLREAGLGGADDLLNRICDALRWNCALNEPTIESARASAYAIWILAREGRIVTQMLEELTQALRENNISGWRQDITHALMTAAMREMRVNASLDFDKLKFGGSGCFNGYAQYSLAMAIMARYFPEELTAAQKKSYFEAVILRLNANDFSTFAASQGTRALAELSKSAVPGLMQTDIRCLANVDERADVANGGAFITVTTTQCPRYAIKLAHEGQPVFWQIATTGFDKSDSQKAAMHGIEITSSITDLDGKPVKTARQGDELFVKLMARADGSPIADCIISSILPGGLEMIVPNKNAEKLPEAIKYIDRQEDRMLIFADLDNLPLEYVYRARAVTPGIFAVPGAAAEAMQDRSLYGASASSSLEITPQ